MAWVLLLLENQGQDKRVESILVPCLDAGSNPAISTKKNSSLHPSLLEGKELFFLYRMPSADWRDYEEIPIYHSSLHPSLLEGKELFLYRMPSADWRDYEEIPIYHSSLHPSLLEGKELFLYRMLSAD